MTAKQINTIRKKVNAAPDKVYNTKVYQYWINGSGQLCRARLANLDTMEMYTENAIQILD